MRRLGIAVLTLLLMFTAAEAKPRKAKSADATKSAATEKKSDKKSDKSAEKSSAKADINTSSEADLEAVNGIGPATAKKIVANRPYASIDDLKKAGLTAAKIDKLRGSLTVSSAAAAPATSTKGSSSSVASKPSSASSSSSAPASSSSSASSSKPSLWERLKGKKADSSAQPAASTSGTGSSSGANTSAGATTTQSASANTPQAPGGGNGKVWVNKDTKVFHREGDRWYGKTKNGEYMTEKDALAAGYRPVKEREKK